MRLVHRVHAIERMFRRGITDSDVRRVLEDGEVIEAGVRCVVCKDGETAAGTATVALEHDGMVLVFRNVPAEVCEVCGEEYVDEETTARLLEAAEGAARAGVQVDVRDYVAA